MKPWWLAERLRHHPFIRDQLTIYEKDALTVDFSELREPGRNLKVYGNLPYNISTPLLFHLLKYGNVISDMTFMLQKEVVDRLTAAPDSKDYGKLTVMAQYFARIMPCLVVPPEAFTPAPKVYSAVVKVIPHATLRITICWSKSYHRPSTSAEKPFTTVSEVISPMKCSPHWV